MTTANILSILRGALNYPLEESCYREHIRVHDISFLSSERVFENEEIAGLEIKYSKLTMVPDSTLMIGDIIASGETLIHCLRYVTDFYREHGAKLRNIIIFTIGGTKGIDILEDLTRDIREFWPEFEGFITVYYEGIFATYQDKGVSGINLPDVDFTGRAASLHREFRRETLSMCSPLFEKCIIYDGGARRYEIHEHVEEVLEFWEGIRERADQINFPKLLEEKLGYELPIDYEDWIAANHYGLIRPEDARWLYRQEQGYVESMKKCDGEGAGGAENRRVHRRVEKIHSVRKPWALIFHTAIHDNRMLAERAFYCLCRRRHKAAMIAEPNWTFASRFLRRKAPAEWRFLWKQIRISGQRRHLIWTVLRRWRRNASRRQRRLRRKNLQSGSQHMAIISGCCLKTESWCPLWTVW